MRDNKIKTPGIIVPPLTPFESSLKIDFGALEEGVNGVSERCHLDLIIAAGVEAQEYQFLPFGERLDLIRATIAAVDGRCPVSGSPIRRSKS
jgi:4-hydroxy-tetrahydrodipicolinate synthase